jgi:nucleoside-diphosphate-sugar epimerase
MNTVLVTGAGGFLGGALVPELLRAGYRVRVLGRNAPSPSYTGLIEAIVGDVCDPRCARVSTAGCDSVIHLAGKAHAIDDDRVNEAEYQSVNVDGTKHLLDGAVASGARKFVFASSVKVFGEQTSGCVDEQAPAAPRTPYARSKWAAEQLVASYEKREGLATVSLRLPLVYGPTHKGNLFRMVAAINGGWFPPLPRVPTVRSMLHVKNFVSAVRVALDSKTFLKPVYVVADAKPYSISEVYDRLREGLGKQPPRWRVPLWALTLGARGGDVLQAILKKPLPLSSATLEKMIGEAWYSPAALIRDMGYRPLLSFESAVPEIIAHYRSALS